MKEAADELLEWWKPESIPGSQEVQIRKRPRGVTAVISPWNSPMILTFKRVIPAVLAGNSVVVKPATSCPLTIMSFLQTVASYFPEGVINVVTGSGGLLATNFAQIRESEPLHLSAVPRQGKKSCELLLAQ